MVCSWNKMSSRQTRTFLRSSGSEKSGKSRLKVGDCVCRPVQNAGGCVDTVAYDERLTLL